MRPVRIVLWVLVVVAAGALAVLLVNQEREPEADGQQITLTSFGGPFTLQGSDGQPFSSTKLSGRPYAIFFGFTHCPDVCPTTLARLVKLRQQLSAGERPFEIIFVSVDPERDKPADVGQYTALFNTPVVGLTGSPAQVEQVKKQFGIFSQKVPQPGGDYSVNHTSTVLLFDRSNHFSGTIATDEGDEAALAKLKRITA
jgi:protein SCO1/2